jgi:hypothetical protein
VFILHGTRTIVPPFGQYAYYGEEEENWGVPDMTAFWIQFSIMIAIVVYVAVIVLPDLWNDWSICPKWLILSALHSKKHFHCVIFY